LAAALQSAVLQLCFPAEHHSNTSHPRRPAQTADRFRGECSGGPAQQKITPNTETRKPFFSDSGPPRSPSIARRRRHRPQKREAMPLHPLNHRCSLGNTDAYSVCTQLQYCCRKNMCSAPKRMNVATHLAHFPPPLSVETHHAHAHDRGRKTAFPVYLRPAGASRVVAAQQQHPPQSLVSRCLHAPPTSATQRQPRPDKYCPQCYFSRCLRRLHTIT